MSTHTDVTYWHLTYDDDSANAHKFYDVYVVGREITYRWGRQGTNGQYKVEQHRSDYTADQQARQQVAKKIGGGYKLEVSAVRTNVELGWYDAFDLATKVEKAMKAHVKSTAVGNRLAAITTSANEIVAATARKQTAGLLNTWADIQRDWEEISIEYKLAEQAVREAEAVITARLMSGE